MSKTNILYIFLFLVILSVGYYFFSSNNTKKEFVKIDYYIINKTWETQEKKIIPYRKGDELEYTFILENEDNIKKTIKYLIENLKKKLNLDDIIITGDNIIDKNGASVIKITGKAKINGISTGNFQDLFKIEEILENKSDFDISNEQEIKEKDKEIYKQGEKDSIEDTILSLSGDLFEKDIFLSDLDYLIKINGTKLDNIKSIGIGEKSFKLFKQDNDYYIFVPKDSLQTGKYFTFIIDKTNKLIALKYSIEFKKIGTNVIIDAILPNKLLNEKASWLTVQGKGLENTLSVQLSNSNILKNKTTDFEVVSDQVIAVKIPSGLSTGKYYINIMTIDGIYNFEDNTFEIY